MFTCVPTEVAARCCAFLALGDQIAFSQASRFTRDAARQPNPAYPRAQYVDRADHLCLALRRLPTRLEVSSAVALGYAMLARVALTPSIESLRISIAADVAGFACLHRLKRLHTLDVTTGVHGHGHEGASDRSTRAPAEQEMVRKSLAAFSYHPTLTALAVTTEHPLDDLRYLLLSPMLVTLRLDAWGTEAPGLAKLGRTDLEAFARLRNLARLDVPRSRLDDVDLRTLVHDLLPQLASLGIGQIRRNAVHWSADPGAEAAGGWHYHPQTNMKSNAAPWSTTLTALRCHLLGSEVMPYVQFFPALECLWLNRPPAAPHHSFAALSGSLRHLRRLELSDDVAHSDFLTALGGGVAFMPPPPLQWLELNCCSAPDLLPLAVLESTLETLVLADWPAAPRLADCLPRLSRLTRLALPLPTEWSPEELAGWNKIAGPRSPTAPIKPTPPTAPAPALNVLLPLLTHLELALDALSPDLVLGAHVNLVAIDVAAPPYRVSHDARYRVLESLPAGVERVTIRVSSPSPANVAAVPSAVVIDKAIAVGDRVAFAEEMRTHVDGDGGGKVESKRGDHIENLETRVDRDAEFACRVVTPLRRRHPRVDIAVVVGAIVADH
jgi:hypothetical protein